MVTRAGEWSFCPTPEWVYTYRKEWQVLLLLDKSVPNLCGKLLFVQNGPQDGNGEVGKVGGALVKLEPANHTMVAEVFCYFRFRDSQVFRELWLDGVCAAAVAAAY